MAAAERTSPAACYGGRADLSLCSDLQYLLLNAEGGRADLSLRSDLQYLLLNAMATAERMSPAACPSVVLFTDASVGVPSEEALYDTAACLRRRDLALCIVQLPGENTYGHVQDPEVLRRLARTSGGVVLDAGSDAFSDAALPGFLEQHLFTRRTSLAPEDEAEVEADGCPISHLFTRRTSLAPEDEAEVEAEGLDRRPSADAPPPLVEHVMAELSYPALEHAGMAMHRTLEARLHEGFVLQRLSVQLAPTVAAEDKAQGHLFQTPQMRRENSIHDQALDRAEAELCFPFADGAEVVVRSSSRGGQQHLSLILWRADERLSKGSSTCL
ncbi:hypothetical protein T484DRAFT_1774643 [Baffinella frigidus]|nr:hypothetical protein T484DRAFT_1774643 [Cryptophyta sp. CCMP2293]